MESFLQEFYKGKIRPSDQNEYISEEYRNREKKHLELEKAFCAELTEKQRREYIRIIDEYTGLLPNEAEEVYIQGMRMGARMAVALLGEDKKA